MYYSACMCVRVFMCVFATYVSLLIPSVCVCVGGWGGGMDVYVSVDVHLNLCCHDATRLSSVH